MFAVVVALVIFVMIVVIVLSDVAMGLVKFCIYLFHSD